VSLWYLPASFVDVFTGLERPPRFPWQRSGVAPAHSEVLPASKWIVALCATSMLPTTSRHPGGDANGDGRVMCVFHAPVTAAKDLCHW